MDIKNKIAIVMGASHGIGEAIAKQLAQGGATVVLAARSADALETLAGQLPGALAVPTDMRDPAAIKQLVTATIEKFGRVDILVNNAGQGQYAPIESVDVEGFKEIMELNVYGPLRAMQEVIPVMKKQGGGTIVNISSMVSKNAFPGLGAYAATKYALNALTFTARNELANDHIIVSAFHPKMTATGFGQNSIGERPQWTSAPRNPAMQVDTAEQVAEQVLNLIHSEAAEANM